MSPKQKVKIKKKSQWTLFQAGTDINADTNLDATC